MKLLISKYLLVQLLLIQLILAPVLYAQQPPAQTAPTAAAPAPTPRPSRPCSQLSGDASRGLFIVYCVPFFDSARGLARSAVYEFQGIREAHPASVAAAKTFRVVRVQNGAVSLVGEMTGPEHETTVNHIFGVSFDSVDTAIRFLFGLHGTESTPSGISYVAAIPAWATVELAYFIMAVFGAPNLSVTARIMRSILNYVRERQDNIAERARIGRDAAMQSVGLARSAEDSAELARQALEEVGIERTTQAAGTGAARTATEVRAAGTRVQRLKSWLANNLGRPTTMGRGAAWAIRVGVGLTVLYITAPPLYNNARRSFARRMARNARIRFAQRLDGLFRLLPACVAAEENCGSVGRHLRMTDQSQAMAQAQANDQPGAAASAGERFYEEVETGFLERTELRPTTASDAGASAQGSEQGQVRPAPTPAAPTPTAPVATAPNAAPGTAPQAAMVAIPISRNPIPVLAFPEFENSINALFRPACDVETISSDEERRAHCGRSNTDTTVGFRQPVTNVHIAAPVSTGLR